MPSIDLKVESPVRRTNSCATGNQSGATGNHSGETDDQSCATSGHLSGFAPTYQRPLLRKERLTQ